MWKYWRLQTFNKFERLIYFICWIVHYEWSQFIIIPQEFKLDSTQISMHNHSSEAFTFIFLSVSSHFVQTPWTLGHRADVCFRVPWSSLTKQFAGLLAPKSWTINYHLQVPWRRLATRYMGEESLTDFTSTFFFVVGEECFLNVSVSWSYSSMLCCWEVSLQICWWPFTAPATTLEWKSFQLERSTTSKDTPADVFVYKFCILIAHVFCSF